MLTLNKIILVGYLSKDLIPRYLDGGRLIVVGRLFTNDLWIDDTGLTKQESVYHNVIFKYDKAKIALEKIHKNDLVYIDGKLKFREWIGKNGLKRCVSEVNVINFSKL